MGNIKGWDEFILENRELSNLIHRRRGETKKRFIDSMKPFHDLKELSEFILNNCSEWLSNPVEITRAIESDADFFYSKPVERYSIGNANDYTIIMDNHPLWEGYPKRGESFICSLGMTHMNRLDYNHHYKVIPVNGSKWGVVPKFDIFHAFYKLKDKYKIDMSIDRLFITIRELAERYDIKIPDSNLDDLKSGIDELNKSFIENPTKGSNEHFTYDMSKLVEDGIDLWDMIIDVINPKNGFSLFDNIKDLYNNVGSIKGNYGDMIEAWTDSPCVFIRSDRYVDYRLLK